MRKSLTILTGCILAGSMLATTTASASWNRTVTYKVTITNLTPGQPLAPVMVATHRAGVEFFKAGAAPSDELAMLAEAGNSQPMADRLAALPKVTQATVSTEGATLPGHSTTVMISAKRWVDKISVGSMLVATNDAFAAIKGADLPWYGGKVTYMAAGYDSGSETNDELSSTVAGLGGEGYSPGDTGEGFVHIHNGVHGIGDLAPAIYDWRNPVAAITIERIH